MELFGDISRDLLIILFGALPFVLLGSLVSGMMEVFLPSEVLTRVLPKNRFLATLSGALAGLALPMCECGVIPVMRRLIGIAGDTLPIIYAWRHAVSLRIQAPP